MPSYRSNLEKDIAEDLKGMGARFEYEPLYIPFSRPKHYQPDFILPNGIVIEAKGYFRGRNRSQIRLVKETWPDLDIRFVFARPSNFIASAKQRRKREKRNRRKGKEPPNHTTYGDWCERRDIPWAELTVPLEWIQEEPNQASLDALEEIRQLPKNQ